MTTTVRVSEQTRARAAALAAERGSSIGDVVDAALEALEKEEFWRQTRQALAAHAEAGEADPLWERTAADGLDRD
ncbi:MAG TPA: hypothetical protein VME70_05200 [Mycobacteriales bacterium]|nr:hypothetical protein [Mycobacteriales bacterium]